ncbi:helix-turn-helix domain-containing protein [Streptomyces sp. NPDC007259]|uniref:helix-turn-helix domain-containing protein n=1 Tax=Streptomyces sp. NPDC007259 TaxID=3154319 RepID=UPI00345324B6
MATVHQWTGLEAKALRLALRLSVRAFAQQLGLAVATVSKWESKLAETEPRPDTQAILDTALARSTALLGDLKRDQGAVLGPLSAQNSYAKARAVFTRLDIPRRVAQLDLSLAVVTEMSGKPEIAAHAYEALAVDDRLSRRDRARARLWVGTALSKDGRHHYATRVVQAAARDFEDLTEPDDWSVAHQKLALARRGAGDLTQALQFIDIARCSGATESPMQRVRLDTAHGHILLSDAATRDDGYLVLDQAAKVATQYGLVHQLRSIEGIRAMSEGPTGSRQR